MAEVKHTPLPWLSEGTTIYALNADGVNRFQAQVSAGFLEYPERGEKTRTSDDEVKAVVRVMTTAPELLEALEDLWMWVKNWDAEFMDDPEFDRSIYEAAIAKARGEAQ